MAQSKAMELDLENEIEKTKKEGILFIVFIIFDVTLNNLGQVGLGYENIGLNCLRKTSRFETKNLVKTVIRYKM